MKKQKEFIPISNEEVQQIINENPSGAAYGCGSGSGSGSGSGCGWGCGSGSGSGDKYPQETSNASNISDNLRSSNDDTYGKFDIKATCVASAEAIAKKFTEYDDWHITIKRGSFDFSIASTDSYAGNDENGKQLVYRLFGDSKKISLLGDRYGSASQTCEITCKGEYPNGKSVSLVVTLGVTLSTSFDEPSPTHKIRFSLGEISINVREK